MPKRSPKVVPRRPTSGQPALAVFARSPSPGRAKTRLISLLGARGAAEFQRALLVDTLSKLRAMGGAGARYLFLAGRRLPPSEELADFNLVRQRGAGLGERLERAFRQLLRRHRAAVVIGTDSPAIARRVVGAAGRELRLMDAVLGPCPDGGYFLIGLRRLSPGLFHGVRWGSDSAFRDTLANLLCRGYACSILEPVADVDRPEDFRRLGRELARNSAARRAAPAVWRFLRQFRRASPGLRAREA